MENLSKLSQEVNILAQLADMKEIDYKNMLIITALIELLIEKGVMSRQEILMKAQALDADMSLFSNVL